MKPERAELGCDGLTLIELMNVVAIIGIVSLVAIPSYRHFVAKARSSEAKLLLSGIYLAEQSFHSNSGSYTGCLAKIGYVGPSGNYYYSHGFSEIDDIDDNHCGPDGRSSCKVISWEPGAEKCEPPDYPWVGQVRWEATARANTSLPIAPLEAWNRPGGVPSIAGRLEQNEFIAIAIGSVAPNSNQYDVWHLTNGRVLRHSQNGLR